MQRQIHTIIAIIACLLCTGCGGFGLGGGSDMGVIPSALEIEDPARKAEVRGRIEVAEGFLPLLLDRLGTEPTASENAVPKGIEIQIVGPKGLWKTELDDEGNFAFKPIYAGNYLLRAVYKETVLISRSISLREKSKMDVTVSVLGYDLADVDEDGERFELLLEVRSKLDEMDTEFLRVTSPDGSAETLLPDGTKEIFHKGRVRIIKPNGDIEYRLDYDNDFLPDDLDRDDDNDGIPDHRDRDLDNDGIADRPRRKEPDEDLLKSVVGLGAQPLLTAVDVSVVGSRERTLTALSPGSLLRFYAETDRVGGANIYEVEARIFRFGRPVYSFRLRDDGSEEDLVPKWPSLQVSGDAVKGDGKFAFILPIDRTTLELLHESLLVFRGRNRKGDFTNTRIVPLSTSGSTAEGSNGRSPSLGRAMGEFSMYERSQGSEKRLVARIDVAAELSDGLTVNLVTPDGGRKVMTTGATRQGERALYASSELSWQTGIYLLIATNRSGKVFYAGFPVRANM